MRFLAYVVVGCLFTYLWLHWVFSAVPWLSPVAEQGYCSLQCLLQSTALGVQLQRVDSVVVECGLSCPVACGIFPDQVSNPCFLHWQMDSYVLNQQGSLVFHFFFKLF